MQLINSQFKLKSFASQGQMYMYVNLLGLWSGLSLVILRQNSA